MPERVAVLIVGAGPTGLGAAWRLSQLRERDWLLCEAGHEAGGLASSVVDEHGFTWDMGGHVQFSHYEYFDDVMDDLLSEKEWIRHERSSWIWMRERFIPYPFQMNLRHLPPRDRWDAVHGLLELEPSDDEPRHFKEWILRTFGEGMSALFFFPYNLKVWAHPLDTLSWRWTGERVAVVDQERVLRNIVLERDDKSWGPNNRFRFPRRGGTGEVWRRLASRLSERHGCVRFGRRLTHLDTRNRVAHFGGEAVGYEHLVSSIPLDRLIALSDLGEDLQGAAARLRYSSTHVVGVGLYGTPPAHLGGKCWMYFPEGNCPFYRVTVFSRYSPENVPDSGRFWSLLAEVSESPFKPVDSTRVSEETVDGLVEVGAITKGRVHHTWHRRLEHGYPVPTVDRDELLTALLVPLERLGVYSRGRFGAWKYEVSNQDHSFAQGVEVVEHLLHGTPERTLVFSR